MDINSNIVFEDGSELGKNERKQIRDKIFSVMENSLPENKRTVAIMRYILNEAAEELEHKSILLE